MKLYLTDDQLAESLHTNKVTLWRLRGEGLPFIRLGKRLMRYDPDDVDRWLKERGGSAEIKVPKPPKGKGRPRRAPQPEKI